MVVGVKKSGCRGMRWLLCTFAPKPKTVRTMRPNEGKLLVESKPGIESRWSSRDECEYGGLKREAAFLKKKGVKTSGQ